MVVHPGAYVIVGMAGFFAGCANAPISTLIMVSEITGDYKLLVPVMWVSTICFVICREWTIYRSQVPTRLESPAHRGELLVDLLEGVHVRDVFDASREIQTVPESTPLSEIVSFLTQMTQNYFPVVDADDRLVGVFSANDVRAFTYESAMWRVTIARDIMVEDVLSVTPDDALNTALRRFTRQ
jgi:CIC family chloride channel protein